MNGQRGFTRGELLIIVVLLCIGVLMLAAISCPSYPRIGPSKEQQVKNNIKTIHTALMRYATDNDGAYPRYIWGGDRAGWDAFYREGPRPGTETAIYDPLIRYGYLDEYPRNPFVRDGRSVIYQTTAFDGEFGQGDPRFGFRGTTVGNGLSDPRFPEADDTLGGADDGTWGGGYTPNMERKSGRTYTMGGWWNDDRGKTVSNHWPGNFFYRSACDKTIESSPSTADVASRTVLNSGDFEGDAERIVGYPLADHFILGGFGASRTIGKDVIRIGDPESGRGGVAYLGLDGRDPIEHYRLSIDSTEPSEEHPIIFPEVFGGGEEFGRPLWPYTDPATGELVYGSPDGSPDGVIIFLTDMDD